MRKDLEECGRACYRREYPWGLVTNGLLLSRQRLDRLLQAGLHSITVSLDGPEDAHNWLRRHPESFRRASQAIGMLSREKEIVWDVVSCINQQNIDTLPVFKEYLIELGVGQWRIFTIFPAGEQHKCLNYNYLLPNSKKYWILSVKPGKKVVFTSISLVKFFRSL